MGYGFDMGQLVCPTQVGIHPIEIFPFAYAYGLPHAGGDTPDASGLSSTELQSAPRRWGYTLDST